MRSFLFCILLSLPFIHTAHANERFMVVYTDIKNTSALAAYDVIVLDSVAHPPLKPLQHRGKHLLGYLSLGEPELTKLSGNDVALAGFVLPEHPNWRGRQVIDIRKPDWAAMVVEELIPEILRQGFDGIMLDTLDSPLHLQAIDPQLHAGVKEAAVTLIKTIRLHYPGLTIMMNRGFDILPQVAGDIDMLLAESIYTTVDGQGHFKPIEPSVYDYHVKWFKELKKTSPRLRVYTLDYWDLNDTEGVRAIYATQRRNDFVPYVSSMDLQSMVEEP